MGQYYKSCILTDNGDVSAWMLSHEYGNGLKLMEHSWLDNDFVAAFESLLALDGARRVVWAGDYADEEPGGENIYHHTNRISPLRFDCAAMRGRQWGDKVEPTDGPIPVEVTTESHPYLLDHDRREYVDKREIPATYETAEDAWRIHPLPLLTCEGNGRGGGDYRGDWPHVGRWARDRISVSQAAPVGWSKIDVSTLSE